MNELVTKERWEAAHQAVVAAARGVEKSIWDYAAALAHVHDNKLYTFDFKSFDEYCVKSLGITKVHAYRLIQSHKSRQFLADSAGNVTHGLRLAYSVPDTERHIREIIKAPEDKQPIVVATAQEAAKAAGREPTAKDYRAAVKAILSPEEMEAEPEEPALNPAPEPVAEEPEEEAPFDLPAGPYASAKPAKPGRDGVFPVGATLKEHYLDSNGKAVPEELHPAWRTISRLAMLTNKARDCGLTGIAKEIVWLGEQLNSPAMVDTGNKILDMHDQVVDLIVDVCPSVVDGDQFLTQGQVNQGLVS